MAQTTNELSENGMRYLQEIAQAVIQGGVIDWEEHWKGLLLADAGGLKVIQFVQNHHFVYTNMSPN